MDFPFLQIIRKGQCFILAELWRHQTCDQSAYWHQRWYWSSPSLHSLSSLIDEVITLLKLHNLDWYRCLGNWQWSLLFHAGRPLHMNKENPVQYQLTGRSWLKKEKGEVSQKRKEIIVNKTLGITSTGDLYLLSSQHFPFTVFWSYVGLTQI